MIDATEFATPAADLDRGFHKSASFNYFPGWHQQATVLELLIHRPAWDALSPQQQAALELACSASATESMALSESLQGPALRVQAEQNQVQVRRWSQEMLTLFADTWQQVAAKHAADDAYFKEVWEDLWRLPRRLRTVARPRLPPMSGDHASGAGQGLTWADSLVRLVAGAASWLLVLLMGAIAAQVVLRKVFNQPQVWLEELHWHLYGAAFLTGLALALTDRAEVQGGPLFSRNVGRPAPATGWIWQRSCCSCCPWPHLVVWKGSELAWAAFARGDRSDLASGLPWRWVIKAVLPAAFALLALASVSRAVAAVQGLRRRREPTP